MLVSCTLKVTGDHMVLCNCFIVETDNDILLQELIKTDYDVRVIVVGNWDIRCDEKTYNQR